MRFTIRISPGESRSSRGQPHEIVAERLTEAGLTCRTIGRTVDVTGDWTTVMRILGNASRSLGVDVASIVLSIGGEGEDASPEAGSPDSRSEQTADEDSFPASDPPGLRPGPT
ncbi:MAG: hypothetical protein ACOC2D_17530 [Spirochaetota bacterium]